MKKIYFYLPEYPLTPTGGVKYHKILYEYFKKKTEGIYLLGNDTASKYADKNKLFKILYGIYCTVKVKRKSIIILSNTAFLHFALPMFLNKLYKKHVYFMIVHHLERIENPEFFRRKFEEYFIKNSDHVMTISQTTLKDLIEFDLLKNKNIKITPPGLDKSNIIEFKKEINNGKIKLLFIGTIEKRKGISCIIKAMKELKELDIELNIIGTHLKSEEYLNSLKEMVSEYDMKSKVFFRGRVSQKELTSYFKDSDIFVFPSLWEGYGMVAAEAMSYGLPVIASDLPSLRDIIDDNLNGYLIETEKPELFSEKIRMFYNDRSLLEKFSGMAFKKSKSFNTWEMACEDIYVSVDKIRN